MFKFIVPAVISLALVSAVPAMADDMPTGGETVVVEGERDAAAAYSQAYSDCMAMDCLGLNSQVDIPTPPPTGPPPGGPGGDPTPEPEPDPDPCANEQAAVDEAQDNLDQTNQMINDEEGAIRDDNESAGPNGHYINMTLKNGALQMTPLHDPDTLEALYDMKFDYKRELRQAKKALEECLEANS